MKIWLISIPQIPRAVFRSSVEETDVDWLYTNPAPFPLVPGTVDYPPNTANKAPLQKTFLLKCKLQFTN